MVNFGGWDMPLEYSGILAEHLAVRTRAGLFDVSHMGEIEIRGPGALELVQWVSCNDASKLTEGQAHYSGLMTGRGTFVDDLLVHKISPSHYLLCVNAGNQELDFEHIASHNSFGAKVENVGPRYAQLALQGPRSEGILARLTPEPLAAIRYYHFAFGTVSGVECLIARTGYTGEDGFELYFDPEFAEKLWERSAGCGQTRGTSSPAAWERGTRCGSKRACASTGTKSTRRPRRSKPAWDGFASLGRYPFSEAM